MRRFRNTRYLVMDDGNIYSEYSRKILKPIIGDGGYYHVNLYIDGILNTMQVHMIVAEVYIPNPDNKPQVNHKDGNKSVNSPHNLEWCTMGENIKHAYDTGLREVDISHMSRIGRIGGINGGSKAGRIGGAVTGARLSKPVIQYTDGADIREYQSAHEASRVMNISRSNICRCCNGAARTCGGYNWRWRDA